MRIFFHIYMKYPSVRTSILRVWKEILCFYHFSPSLSLFLLYISHLFVFTMVISHMERTIIFFRSLSLVSAFSPLCVNVYSPCLPFFFKKIYPSLISRQCQCQSLNQASLAGSDFAVSLLSWVSWLFFFRVERESERDGECCLVSDDNEKTVGRWGSEKKNRKDLGALFFDCCDCRV